MSHITYLNECSWRLASFFSRGTSDEPTNEDHAIDIEDHGAQKYALIYGGNGALGSKCIFDLKTNGWWVSSVDFSANTHADVNILILREEDPTKHEDNVLKALQSILPTRKLDLIFCTAGNYQQGCLFDDFIRTGINLWYENVLPSMICASIASKCLKPHGLLIFTGALSVVTPKPDMIAFGMAKSSVIYLTKCLALPGSGLPENSHVICLLPLRLDTVSTRSLNRHSDKGGFTPLQYVSDLVLRWANKKDRPINGSLCQLLTHNFITDCVVLNL